PPDLVDNTPFLRRIVEDGHLPWAKMPTLFAATRLLGGPVVLAYVIQASAALAAAAAVLWVWRRQAPLAVRAAALVAAALLASPYSFDYDLTLLGLAVAWLAWDGWERGFRPREKLALLAGWLAPAVAPPLAAATGVQVAPLAIGWILICALSRARG